MIVVVVLGRRVEVVVVRVEPGVVEPARLLLVEHAEGHADLEAEVVDLAHHLEHAVELRVVLHLAPRGTHAEAGDPLRLGAARRSRTTSSTSMSGSGFTPVS